MKFKIEIPQIVQIKSSEEFAIEIETEAYQIDKSLRCFG